MRKAKINNVPKQSSKISDFFNKVPTQSSKNGISDNKRKLSDLLQSTESTTLNSVTNLPQKCNQQISPTFKRVKHDENCLPSNLADNLSRTESSCVNDVSNIFKVVTPEKHLKPSASMKTPTPNKSPGLGSFKNRTPQSARKGTPKKLFEKSPRRLEEFNVQVLRNFVQVSPSTSNKKMVVTNTPSKSHIQGSIMQYVSPRRSSPAQCCNETTPLKSPKRSEILSPKFKIKLNFPESKVSPSKTKMDEVDNKLIKDVKIEFDSFLDEEFDLLLSIEEDNKLTFDESRHCKILEVNNNRDEKVLLKLKSDNDNSIGWCSVEEFWASGNRFKAGDHVYVKAEKIGNTWIVNNTKGWLVYEPDLLIPCTYVVGSLYCKRKGILADRFRGFDSSNRIMVIGVLVHTLLQQALKNKLKTAAEIEALLNEILTSKDNVKRLYESSLTLDEIKTELQTFVPKLTTFIDEYVTRNSMNQPRSENWQGKICHVDDIEENFWVPELGIKGKIDVTIRGEESSIMPLELKTGRATVSLEHRGQVVLYIMMMNKLGYNVSSGLLLYLREGVLKEIKATPQEKRDVMILRNEMAYFLAREMVSSSEKLQPPELPEPLYNHRACPKCPYNTICTTYLKYENHDISRNKVIKDVQKDATSHLTDSHRDYFMRWTNILSMEAETQNTSKSLRRIYTVPPEKRKALGKCISNLKIKFVGDDRNGLYDHTFEQENSTNMTSHEIGENSYVVVSTDNRPAVATGFITTLSTSQIIIALDRNLNLKYRGQSFHLDTYESNIIFTFNMTSLALLIENTPRAAELRNIIIDKASPTFFPKLPSIVAKKGAPILRRLNRIQQKAVLKALCAKQFFLIKGMPGTGKSATIVALIQLLVELDKSVLVTSHTHSAIDNICGRLQKRGVDFIRLGSESKIDPSIKAHSEATLTKNCTTPEQLEEVYNRYKVITVTCLGSSHPVISKRTVDVCIVDESTQVTQTSVIKPLYAAKTFILIGDPNQLAPTVKSKEAIELGMSESLFERLEDSDGTIALNLNYRMNKTITDLANVLTYKGELQPANDEVAKRTLQIPNPELIAAAYSDHKWLLKAMNTSLEASVQLIDTGPVWKLPQEVKWSLKYTKSEDGYDIKNCVNVYEIAIAVTLVKALIKGGVSSSDIGVITTFRAQMVQISEFLNELNVDVSTVDQFQGRDKNVIIYSCTKSVDPSKTSSDGIKFELLEDKRRLTVAITRAKRKLLIVGDVSTLQKYKTFSVILPTLKTNCIQFDSPETFVNHF